MSESPDHTTSSLDPSTRPTGRLPRSLRGYDRTATDALLEEIATKQAQLERECTALRAQVVQLENDVARHREQEELVSKTLIAATSHATILKDKARQEAELFLSKARAELERRTELADRIDRQRTSAERDLVRLQQLAEEMQTGLEGFLTKALRDLHPADAAATRELSHTDGDSGRLVNALEGALTQEPAPRPEEGVASSRPGL